MGVIKTIGGIILLSGALTLGFNHSSKCVENVKQGASCSALEMKESVESYSLLALGFSVTALGGVVYGRGAARQEAKEKLKKQQAAADKKTTPAAGDIPLDVNPVVVEVLPPAQKNNNKPSI